MVAFTTRNNQFELNGAPFRILSGALHYFRVPPQYWDDRLRKMKLMGLNTVETYVPWNLHEPQPGRFCFDGWLDLAGFIGRAAEAGLYAIVRPGPYICAEWDMGGLPAWLLQDPKMQLRCMYPPYLNAVDRFFDALIPHLAPLQISRGGPVLAMQIENEYGGYGNDMAYLHHLEAGLRWRGIDTLLFTSDGPDDAMLEYGGLPHILKTVNFGTKAAAAFEKLRTHQPTGPLMCTEFWDGWFDHWGEPHHTRSAESTAATLDEILAAGASFSFYMVHGGTNFGFMNGANCRRGENYQPTVTSYDYDAPLNEAGDITAKYRACRDVIGKYAPLTTEPLPAPAPKLAPAMVELTESAALFPALAALSSPVTSPTPQPMEYLGQSYGFILYRTQIPGERAETPLFIQDLHDRAQIFVNGQAAGVLEREFPEKSLTVTIPAGGAQLDILVENMGRVNYDYTLTDRKGATGVTLGQQLLFGWSIYPLPLDDLSALRFAPAQTHEEPAFFRGVFNIDAPLDTFIALPGFTKGICWVNGFNLGRYWNRGPQKTLYLPAPILRPGTNEVIVFELHHTAARTIELRAQPDLG